MMAALSGATRGCQFLIERGAVVTKGRNQRLDAPTLRGPRRRQRHGRSTVESGRLQGCLYDR